MDNTPKNYEYVVQFKHNGKWWITAQSTTIEAANKFIAESKKEFGYEYRAIPFEQYAKERAESLDKKK
jgi:hypothetical protein